VTAIVYVDGFNLYYGALKGTAYKWLDLPALCRRLVPDEPIAAIRYFTARVKARPEETDGPKRQDAYLRALASCPEVSIHYGQFLVTYPRMALKHPAADGPRTVEVVKTEEKGTDVNLGSHVLLDAFDRACDLAVMIGNDSDLVMPLSMAKERFGVRIGLINPQRFASRELQKIGVEFVKPVRPGTLAACQFPDKVPLGPSGFVRKPEGW
jgi:hypothetical protein